MLSTNELDHIVSLAETANKLDIRSALATVTAVSGSSYRRPGARLFVCADGEFAGCISGGCLERNVIQKCRLSIAENSAFTLTYDTGDFGNENFGLGCGGSITILVEPVLPGSPHLQWMSTLRGLREPAVLITSCGIGGQTGLPLGMIALRTAGSLQHRPDVKGELLEFIAQTECGETRMVSCLLRAGRAELFFEVVAPRPALLIFGAGPDALPLAKCARLLGYRVTILDERPGTLSRLRGLLPEGVVCRAESVETLCEQSQLTRGAACVIATHNEVYDCRVLRAALQSNFSYIGLLGPKQRAMRMLDLMSAEQCDATVLNAVHAPAGLDIGGDTPEQIALSILSEIQAVVARREGGFLRDRNAPLHDARNSEAESVAA